MISRFNFNISIYENFINIFKIFFYKPDNQKKKLETELKKFYDQANFYFFDHGRTAFYEILNQIKKSTHKKKILVNSLTLFEVINVIIYSEFEPIFIDNKENSFQTEIDLNNLKTELDNVAAIVITHLNGINENIVNLKKQIMEHNKHKEKIYLIEDCAVSLGSQSNKTNVGSFGDYCFLSFNIMKNITSYTGGVLVDNKKNITSIDVSKYKESSKIDILKKMIFVFVIQLLNSKILFFLFFKLIKYSHKYSFDFFLKKYRTDFKVKIENKFPSKFSHFMHSFQMKILLDQFKSMKEKQISKINKSEIYFNNLKHIKYLSFPQSEFCDKNIFLEFPIICETKNMKENLFDYLLERKIDVKNYYYKNCCYEKIYDIYKSSCSNSQRISDNILMLPVHEKIEKNYQNKIIHEINNFFNKK